MIEVASRLCGEVQNCVFAYTQSDEISLVLVDYFNLNTDVWFGNNIQKICSVLAAKASVYFNDFLRINASAECSATATSKERKDFLTRLDNKNAFFDARCFNIPKEDVLNYFIWRQKDCYKNSVSAVAQYYFSNKELYKKSTKERIEMINHHAEENNVFKYEDFSNTYLKGTVAFPNSDIFVLDFMENRDELNKMLGVKE